jgi:hypothetical protein
VTASDCGATTFFIFSPSRSAFRFCGTSAAAPHSAGVAALVRSANPGATNAQVRAALETTARPIGTSLFQFGPDAVGAGLLDANSAVASLALPPKVTIVTPPAAVSKVRRPSIAFVANRRATFVCSLDGAAAAPCASPYVPAAPLAQGPHTFKVTATDVAGRQGTATASFKIDLKAPTAKFGKRPPKVIRTKRRQVKVSFRFSSNEKGSTFLCKVDSGKFRSCKAPLTRKFGAGRHRVAVKAVDAAGNVGKPVAYGFKVERLKPKKHRGKHHRS